MKVAFGRWPLAAALLGGFVLGMLPAAPVWAHDPPITIELSLLGNPILYRDGIEQDYWTLTGTGLPKVFEGVPEAVALAERYQLWLNGGNAVSVVGNLMVSGGLWYAVKHEMKLRERPGPWAFAFGGLVLAGAGALAAQASRPLIYEAVNVFNKNHKPGLHPEVGGEFTDTGHPQGKFLLTYDFGK